MIAEPTAPMLIVPIRLLSGVTGWIRRHACETYPNECCGALLGRGNEVVEAYGLENTTDEGPRRRFLIRPDDYRFAEHRAKLLSAELLGFYHSHPDHLAQPSKYDLEHAWPAFSYVIVSVEAGTSADVRSWVLREDRSAFDEQAVEVDGSFGD